MQNQDSSCCAVAPRGLVRVWWQAKRQGASQVLLLRHWVIYQKGGCTAPFAGAMTAQTPQRPILDRGGFFFFSFWMIDYDISFHCS